jgi:hypothetical protein
MLTWGDNTAATGVPAVVDWNCTVTVVCPDVVSNR